jgi:hypothetical protein
MRAPVPITAKSVLRLLGTTAKYGSQEHSQGLFCHLLLEINPIPAIYQEPLRMRFTAPNQNGDVNRPYGFL